MELDSGGVMTPPYGCGGGIGMRMANGHPNRVRGDWGWGYSTSKKLLTVDMVPFSKLPSMRNSPDWL